MRGKIASWLVELGVKLMPQQPEPPDLVDRLREDVQAALEEVADLYEDDTTQYLHMMAAAYQRHTQLSPVDVVCVFTEGPRGEVLVYFDPKSNWVAIEDA